MDFMYSRKILTSLISISDAILASVFPWQCPVCLEPTISWRYCPICPSCWQRLQYVPIWCCYRCGKPMPSLKYHDHLASTFSEAVFCPDCSESSHACDTIRSALIYTRQGTARAAILALKHSRMLSLVHPLSQVMIEQYHRLMPAGAVDIVIPVPLHKQRLLIRGFNQAHLLAVNVARHLNITQNHRLLVRTKSTPPQSGRKEKRVSNVAGAFSVTKPSVIKGRRILIIDDVMTTGATLEACALALKSAGCTSVRAMTVARIPG